MKVVDAAGTFPDADAARVREMAVAVYREAAGLRLTPFEMGAALSYVLDKLFRDHGVVMLPESIASAMAGGEDEEE